MSCVSPPGEIQTQASEILHIMEKNNPSRMDVEVESVQDTTSDEPECIMCRLNVPGHIHKRAGGVTRIIPSAAEPKQEVRYFGRPQHPPSPILKAIHQLPHLYLDAFTQLSLEFTPRDVYDTIGMKHDNSPRRSSKKASAPQVRFVDVANEILQDTSSLVAVDQIIRLHSALDLEEPRNDRCSRLRFSPCLPHLPPCS